jgi:hypothetical protein
MEKRDGDVTVVAVLTHHVLAAILFDGATVGVLRLGADRTRGDKNHHRPQQNIDSNLAVDLHQDPPQLIRRNSAMQFVPSLLKVIAPSVAGGSVPIARSLERLWIGAMDCDAAPPAVAQ